MTKRDTLLIVLSAPNDHLLLSQCLDPTHAIVAWYQNRCGRSHLPQNIGRLSAAPRYNSCADGLIGIFSCDQIP